MVLPRGHRRREDRPGTDPRAEEGRRVRDRRVPAEQGHPVAARTPSRFAEPLLRLAGEGRGAGPFPDPVAFPHRYADPSDAEAVAFIAASFAFGGVHQIRNFLARLLDPLGPSPHAVLVSGAPLPHSAGTGPRHRFISGEGAQRFLLCLREAYRSSPTLEHLYVEGRAGEPPDLRRDLSRFLGAFRAFWGGALPRQRDFLFPRPERGSACKRHNMFLRWMVRGPDGVDLGLWKALAPGDLVVPLDTHMVRLGGWLGLTRRKTPGWRMAEEITAALRTVSPEDPVQFDYPLTRLGILRLCTRPGRRTCGVCPVAPLCSRRAGGSSGNGI